MNKKCLIIISGHTREFKQAISSIRSFAARIANVNNVDVSVVFVTWDKSYSYFPNPRIRSFIEDVSKSSIAALLIDNTTFRIDNSYITVLSSVTALNSDTNAVAVLNSSIHNQINCIEQKNNIRFDYIVKIRPDLYIDPSMIINLTDVLPNQMYAQFITLGQSAGLYDMVTVFGRHSLSTYLQKCDTRDHVATFRHAAAYGLEVINLEHNLDCNLHCIPIRPNLKFLPNSIGPSEYVRHASYWGNWQALQYSTDTPHPPTSNFNSEHFCVNYMLDNNINFARINSAYAYFNSDCKTKMKIVIPMAGVGSRFSTKGHLLPKPLIQFLGKPMIQHVVEHLGLYMQYEHIFLCQKEHIEKYNLHELFSSFVPNFKIVAIDGITSGAATTVAQVASAMNLHTPILIVNSDQIVHWDKKTDDLTSDGTIFCFPGGTGTKWSYAAVDGNNRVTKVAEKVQISEHATTGMYYWKSLQLYLDSYNKMVAANDRVNNEFYVAPVYNYALDMNIDIRYIHSVDQVGTPEELDEYVAKFGVTDNNDNSKLSKLLNLYGLK